MSIAKTALLKGTPLKVVSKILEPDCTIAHSPADFTRYLPVPLVEEEVVVVLDNVAVDCQFVKVRHNRGKTVSTFSKRYFRHIKRTVQ